MKGNKKCKSDGEDVRQKAKCEYLKIRTKTKKLGQIYTSHYCHCELNETS